MHRVLIAASFLAISGSAYASGTYPTTLSFEERERHEFFDAQRGIRSGTVPVRPREMIVTYGTGDRYPGAVPRMSPSADNPGGNF